MYLAVQSNLSQQPHLGLTVKLALNWSLSTRVRVERSRGALDPVKGTRHWSVTPRSRSISCDHHTTKWPLNSRCCYRFGFALMCTWISSQISFKLTGNFLYGLMHLCCEFKVHRWNIDDITAIAITICLVGISQVSLKLTREVMSGCNWPLSGAFDQV